MRKAGLHLYHELAEFYDALEGQKDYQGDCRRLEAIARRYGRPGRSTWLDVACGTGRHLEFLRRRHSAVGVDSSLEMLRIARHRLPKVRLVRGDMRSFRLNRPFDVVSCLFSAIGHLQTEAEVRSAFATLASHLNPGGVAIVEPWVQPSAWRSGTLHLRTGVTAGGTLVCFVAASRRGPRSVVQYHYLVGKPGAGIRYLSETDVGLMLSRERLLTLLRGAGLRPRFRARGLSRGRGLLIAIKGESP